ncbi:hypothetical protein MJO28_017612 [Puccinia striiformis f. sp. tritici]|nr:hypothetical protein MJO28_017612 [Puccinia striiformis f. sp. tritici]
MEEKKKRGRPRKEGPAEPKDKETESSEEDRSHEELPEDLFAPGDFVHFPNVSGRNLKRVKFEGEIKDQDTNNNHSSDKQDNHVDDKDKNQFSEEDDSHIDNKDDEDGIIDYKRNNTHKILIKPLVLYSPPGSLFLLRV